MKNIFITLLLVMKSFLHGAEGQKVALMFLTRADLNHTEIWKEWIDLEKYNVYNHSKNPAADPWFRQFRIAESQPNEWGFLILAQQALLKAAVQDPENTKFVFLSESCIPLYNADEVYEYLTADDSSYMAWRETWWPVESNRSLSEMPLEFHLGAPQWIILNRKHAEMWAFDDYWCPLAMQHMCCDEAYPATFYNMMGELGAFKQLHTTHVDWDRGFPYVYAKANIDNITRLIDAKFNSESTWGPAHCLFARKFAPEFPDKVIRYLINLKEKK